LLFQIQLIFICIVVRSSATVENDAIHLLKNGSIDQSSINSDPLHNSKSKRELNESEFDTNHFDSVNAFPTNQIDSLTYHENNNRNIFIPPSTVKVARSNSPSLGTHGQNYELSNYPNANYHSSSHPIVKSVEPKDFSNLNGDQDTLSQHHHVNTAYNNQVTPPYFESFLAQPKYLTTKSDPFSNNIGFKSPMKLQYNSYPEYTEFPSSIPLYNSIAQMPIQSIIATDHHQIQQQGSEYSPYAAQLMQNLKTVQPASKTYTPLHRDNQQQQHQLKPQYQTNDNHPYGNIEYATSPTVEINGKKVPLPILQLQANHPFPSYVQTLEATPVIFSSETGLQYKTNPNFDISFDFAKPRNIITNQRSNLNTPYVPSLYNYGSGSTQILPVQSSSSTAQFPKFKGASIGQVPSREFTKIPNDYQEFKSQSHLHFDGNLNKKPLEKIRTDVEIINKKKSIPPLPKDDDDDESSESDSVEGL
jgi:hypothetical protein